MARARSPEARARAFIDRAFEQLDDMDRDDVLFFLGGVAGRISQVRYRLTSKVAEPDDDEQEVEAPPPESKPPPPPAPPPPASSAFTRVDPAEGGE